MNQEWVETMKMKGRIKLSWLDLLTHYLVVIFLLMPPLFFSFFWLKYVFTGEYTGVMTFEEMFHVQIPFILLAFVFFFIQYKRLEFKSIQTSLPLDLIQKFIAATADELEWVPLVNSKYYKVFKTYPKWYTGSWGEQITVIIDNDKVMINSICDPDRKASVVSAGRNRKNMRCLIDKIKNASR